MLQPRAVGLLVLVAALGSTIGCGRSNPTKPDDSTPSGGNPPVPLIDLLARLPRECWPKDGRDTLRCEKAKAWYKANAAGHRAVWPAPDTFQTRRLEFKSDEKSGKYDVRLMGRGPAVKLFEGEWQLSVVGPGGHSGLASNYIYVRAGGLSVSAAERLRKVPGEQPLELTLTVDEVWFEQFSGESIVVVSAKGDVAITGISE